jgi:hypothetical protein
VQAEANRATAPLAPSDKENAPVPVASKKAPAPKAAARRGRAKGLGSKSGPANRRKAGGSDDEVEELTVEQKDMAGLKIPQVDPEIEGETPSKKLDGDGKHRVVEYITSAEVWPSFKLKQVSIFVKVRPFRALRSESIGVFTLQN